MIQILIQSTAKCKSGHETNWFSWAHAWHKTALIQLHDSLCVFVILLKWHPHIRFARNQSPARAQVLFGGDWCDLAPKWIHVPHVNHQGPVLGAFHGVLVADLWRRFGLLGWLSKLCLQPWQWPRGNGQLFHTVCSGPFCWVQKHCKQKQVPRLIFIDLQKCM